MKTTRHLVHGYVRFAKKNKVHQFIYHFLIFFAKKASTTNKFHFKTIPLKSEMENIRGGGTPMLGE